MTSTKPFYPKDKVKVLREAYGMTQKQFADRLGLAMSTIGRWENPKDDRRPVGTVAIELHRMAKRKRLGLFDHLKK